MHAGYGVEDVLGWLRLEHHAARAAQHGVTVVGWVDVTREQDDLDVGVVDQRRNAVDGVGIAQAQVQQHHVGLWQRRVGQQLGAGAGRAADAQARLGAFDQLAQAPQRDGVVVGQQHANRVCLGFGGGG